MTAVRSLRDDERDWIRALTRESWADETVVSHGAVFRPHSLPGLVAMDDDGERVGLVTYTIDGGACEVVTPSAFVEGSGHGRAMIEAVREGAVAEARKLKPSIPLVSEDGVPITDEIELECRL